MIRLLLALIASLRLLPLHLRSDKRKGSHAQRTHGNRYSGSGSSRTLTKAGGGKGGSSGGSKEKRSAGSMISRMRSESSAPKKKERQKYTWKPEDDYDDDDLDYLDSTPSTKKEKSEQQKYEEKLLRDFEKAQKAIVYKVVMEQGGLKTRDDLREEYRKVPNTYKRTDGMDGDELADHFARYFPEFGVESENDLLDFLAS